MTERRLAGRVSSEGLLVLAEDLGGGGAEEVRGRQSCEALPVILVGIVSKNLNVSFIFVDDVFTN